MSKVETKKWYIASVESRPNGGSFATCIGPYSESLDEAVGAARFHAHMEMKAEHPEGRSPNTPEISDLKLHNDFGLVTFSSQGYKDKTYYLNNVLKRGYANKAADWGPQDANGIYQPR